MLVAASCLACQKNQPLRPLVRPVEDLEQIRAELFALIERQVEALERDTFVGLADVERYEYDARHDRIREFTRKWGNLRLPPRVSLYGEV